MAFETTPLFPFYAEYESVLAGSISIVYVDIAGQHWSRDDARIASDEFDFLAVNISIDITARGTMGARQFEQTPGTALLHDTRQPSDHRSTSGKSITLMISRPNAVAHGLFPGPLTGLVLPEPSCRVLLAHLQQLREFRGLMDPEKARLVEHATLDLLIYSIRSSACYDAATMDGTARSEVQAIKEFVHQQFESQSLRVSRVARDLKLSRSTLYRHFLDHGGLQAFIRNERLDAARMLLVHSVTTHSIATIAERFCFADVGHFSRLFHKRFGLPPAAFRSVHGRDCRENVLK